MWQMIVSFASSKYTWLSIGVLLFIVAVVGNVLDNPGQFKRTK